MGLASAARWYTMSTSPSTSRYSVTSWLTNSKFSPRRCSMFWSEPVSRLSMQTTRKSRSTRCSHRWEPRKPAPPVTTAVGIGPMLPMPPGRQPRTLRGLYSLRIASTQQRNTTRTELPARIAAGDHRVFLHDLPRRVLVGRLENRNARVDRAERRPDEHDDALVEQTLEALEVHAPDLALLVRHGLGEVVARRVEEVDPLGHAAFVHIPVMKAALERIVDRLAERRTLRANDRKRRRKLARWHRQGVAFAEAWPPAPGNGPHDDGNPLRAFFDARTEGRGIWKWNHYFDVYHRHFERFRGQEVHILEVGIYSGGSLEMWHDYF